MNTQTPDTAAPPRTKRISRRKLLAGASLSLMGLGAATFGYTWRLEPHWVEVVRRPLPIAMLPDALVGKTLIQISDLHVGPIVDETYISSALELVSSLQPDILVITGDFMTCQAAEQLPATLRVLHRLRPASLATLAILGNHDYGHTWRNTAVADGLSERLPDVGITLLRNQVHDVAGLQIGGMDDYWGPFFSPSAVVSQLDARRASLMLCHNPDAMDIPGWDGYRGWVLAGHTHGGQCKPPYFAPPITPVKNKRYTAGEFDFPDGRRLYINRGLGYLRRVRFNARPEITRFTLQRAAASM